MEQKLIDRILKQSTDPDAYELIEQLVKAARDGAVEDICIDLADFDQHEAVSIIRTNY